MTDREAMQQAQLEKLEATLWLLNQHLTRKQAEIDALRAQAAPPQLPVAWGYRDRHGNIIDVITPAEHARAQGSYTIPLYTAPTRQWQPLPEDTLEELLGLHCSTSGNMSEADAREFAKDLGSRIKELNA